MADLGRDQKVAWLNRVLGVAVAARQPDDGHGLALRERVLVTNAHRALSDYLDLRDTADAVSAIEAPLRRTESALQAWRNEFGVQGAADQRERMELLARKVDLERSAFDSVQVRLAEMDTLIAAMKQAANFEQRSSLRTAIQDELSDLAA